MTERTLNKWQIYRHFKGNYYLVIGEAEHTETKENLVIYVALYGDNKVYARPKEMFLSRVDKVKYPKAKAKWRMTPVNIDKGAKIE